MDKAAEKKSCTWPKALAWRVFYFAAALTVDAIVLLLLLGLGASEDLAKSLGSAAFWMTWLRLERKIFRPLVEQLLAD